MLVKAYWDEVAHIGLLRAFMTSTSDYKSNFYARDMEFFPKYFTSRSYSLEDYTDVITMARAWFAPAFEMWCNLTDPVAEDE